MVEWLFLALPWGFLRFVIVVFPDHTHLLFLALTCILLWMQRFLLICSDNFMFLIEISFLGLSFSPSFSIYKPTRFQAEEMYESFNM